MTGDLLPFPSPLNSISSDEGRAAAEQFLGTPIEERKQRIGEFHLDQSETLLAVCQLLEERKESTPAGVAEDAEFTYQLLENLPASSGSFLFDEREYYLGELALLVGTACRFLSHRDQARKWFDRAEIWFLLTANAHGDIARLAYQRLALKMEERLFDEVLRTVPALLEAFERMKATESCLKCRSLRAIALKETGQSEEALRVFRALSLEAQALGSEKLLGSAHVNMIQLHATLGEADEALQLARETMPLLRRLNNRSDMAKLQWGIGDLLRTQGKFQAAVDTFRAVQEEFAGIEMHADVAALHLAIADLLLELGQDRQAEWEIRQALPVIDELKMVPEGVAALSLLRESLRRRSIDRQALRDLHGYFDDKQN